MKKALVTLLVVLAAAVTHPGQTPSPEQQGGVLTFEVTDGRSVITRDVGRGLVLRAVKERSVTQEHYGWRVEVVRGRYRTSSRNLLYPGRRTLGAHPSQVYAWHVRSNHFPDRRELRVSGHPVTVKVELIRPVAEGEGPDSRFKSGEVRITWGRDVVGRAS